MTTFSQIILHCPHCGIKMQDYEMMSITIHHSTVYSDGKQITEPWMNNDKAIAMCPDCNEAFWWEDAGIQRDADREDGLPSASDVYDLPFMLQDNAKEQLIQFYHKLLQSGFANTNDRKIYLRFRIWWGINDFIRYRKPLIQELSELGNLRRISPFLEYRRKSAALFNEHQILFKENLEKLISIFKPEHEEEQLMVAEMYRELGQMRKAKAVLQELQNMKSSSFRKISKAIAKNQKRVMKL